MVIKEQPIIKNNTSPKVLTTLFSSPHHNDRRGEGRLRKKGHFKNTSNENPLISIITVVFNGSDHIEQTIKTVINQTYPNIEYIRVPLKINEIACRSLHLSVYYAH